MPFKSKAQQRFMFANDPAKAKEWARETKDIKSLPGKINPGETVPASEYKKDATMTKKSSGMFFKEASQSQDGHFFRDAPGRDKANFYEKTAQEEEEMGMGRVPSGGGMNVSPPGMQSSGKGVGGGMYGSGEGAKAKGGKERKADEGEDKTAALSPSDWDNSGDIPTGFHRPTTEQPEALEPGGDRFHDSDAPSPEYGTGGLVEGGTLNLRQGTGHQMGKNANDQRFLGTSYGLDKEAKSIISSIEDYAGPTAAKAGRSVQQAARTAGRTADKALQSAAGSPAAMGIAALLAARFGIRGVGKIGRGALRAAGRKPKPGLVGSAVGAVKKALS